ncbi:transcriptional protein SWT1, partial [Trichonephila inaurata madagascariensis]
ILWINILQIMEGSEPKGSLPEGWIVKVSKKYPDRVYYFNTLTGCSTWECPKLEYSPNNKMSKHTSILNKHSTKDTIEAHEHESPETAHKKISSTLQLQKSKIIEFLSDAKKESLKRMKGNDAISSTEDALKPNTPAVAIVTPVISENSALVQQKVTSVRSKPSTAHQQKDYSVVSVKKSKKSFVISKPMKDAFTTKLDKISFKLRRSSDSDRSVKAISKLDLSKVAILQKASSCSKVQKSLLTASQNATSVKKSPSTSASAESEDSVSSNLKQTASKKKIHISPLINNKIKFDVRGVSAKLSSSKTLSSFVKDNKFKRKILPVELSEFPKNDAIHSSKSKRHYSVSGGENLEMCTKKSKISDLTKEQKDKEPSLSFTNKESSPSSAVAESDSEFSDMEYEMTSEVEETASTSAEFNVGASTSKSSDSDSLDDVEMLDLSSEITKVANGPSWVDENLLDSYYIVLDTNTLISDLKYIDEMKDTPVDGCGPLHFVIPWVALQELDKMKSHRKKISSDVIRGAKEAIRYIFAVFKANHPRFHKQNPREADSETFNKTNDDQILDYCLTLQKSIPHEKLILLTNDRNLSNKAMACNVVVHDKYSLAVTLKPDLINVGKTRKVKAPKSDTSKSLNRVRFLGQKYGKEYKNCEMEIHTLMSKARQLLKDIVTPLFEREMDEAYGDAWHFFKVDRNTLQGILAGILKYWRTVFTFLFSTEDQVHFEFLLEKTKRPEGFLGERDECLGILAVIEDVLNVIKKKWPADGTFGLAEIKRIKRSTENNFSVLSDHKKYMDEVENEMNEAEFNCVLELFNHNWTVINHLCGAAMDFCKLPHDIVYDTTAPVPPKEAFLRVMPELSRNLYVMKELMDKMIDAVKNDTLNMSIFKELNKLLIELVPSLNIQAENLNFGHLTPKMLERFCRCPENRTRIEEGYKQLLKYLTNLSQAIHALLT